jgi:hypothetical protein
MACMVEYLPRSYGREYEALSSNPSGAIVAANMLCAQIQDRKVLLEIQVFCHFGYKVVHDLSFFFKPCITSLKNVSYYDQNPIDQYVIGFSLLSVRLKCFLDGEILSDFLLCLFLIMWYTMRRELFQASFHLFSVTVTRCLSLGSLGRN